MYHVSYSGGDSGLRRLTSSRVWIPAEFWADYGGQHLLRYCAPCLAHHLEYLFCGVGGYVKVELRRGMMQPASLADAAFVVQAPCRVKFPLQLLRVSKKCLRPQPAHHLTVSTMSRASQITLATTCVTAVGIVAFVHWSQKADKAVSTARIWMQHGDQF